MSKDTTANRADLARICALVRPALASQPYVPALVHIAFDGKTATAYNDKAAISVRCEVPVRRLVPGVLLIQALDSFDGSEVLFQQGDDKHLMVVSGRAKVNLPTRGLEAFPFSLPDGDDGIELDLDDEIVRGIERCLISVNSDAAHPAQMGVTLDCDGDGEAVLYSTDNRSVSRFSTGSKAKLPGGAPVIMPTFFCEQMVSLRKAFPKEECWVILRSDSLVAHFGGEATLFSRTPVDLQPMDFPAIYKRFVGESPKLVPIPDSLDGALDRALLVLAGEAAKKTELEVTRGGIMLRSTCPAGDADDACEGETKGLHDGPVNVEPHYLARAAKATTRMGVTPKVTAFADDKGQFLHLIAHLA